LVGINDSQIYQKILIRNSIYTIGPLDVALFESPTGYPFIDLFFSATKSLAATDVMTAVLIINFTASAIAVCTTASRQLWAFARNHGMPSSEFLAPVCSLGSDSHASKERFN
jgi:amino acid transporter